MSHDEELERAMHKIGALRYELELLQSENKLVREESDRHYQLWVDSQAEVERLTKAGDAMVELLVQMDVIMDMDSDHPEVEAWNAAKEGKPSV